MKIVACSDLHGTLPIVEECDLCIVAGDLCPVWNRSVLSQSAWLNGVFRRWLQEMPAKKIVAIAGNHDFIYQTAPQLVPKDLPLVYLQDDGFEYEGVKIWGTPWTSIFLNWAFMLSEEDLNQRWQLIPEDTNILVSHGPPKGYGDLVDGSKHVGSASLLARIYDLKKLKLHVFGHIHSAHSIYRFGEAILANVTIMNDDYQVVHKPTVINI